MRRRDFTFAGLCSLAGLSTLSRSAFASDTRRFGQIDALIVIDVQNCFLPGGSLPVAGGDQIIPLINKISAKFDNVVLTQDWHPADHVSFAEQHSGKKAFESVQLAYGQQTLWPSHCVQGSEDASIANGLKIPHAQLILRKGFNRHIDSYSAFLEANQQTNTGLDGYLKSRGIKNLYLCGLATDFCVAWSAMDAIKLGFNTAVIEDASRAIDLNGSLVAAWRSMQAAGVKRLMSNTLLNPA
jgi:nicotinamidase/pyrazinamidase